MDKKLLDLPFNEYMAQRTKFALDRAQSDNLIDIDYAGLAMLQAMWAREYWMQKCEMGTICWIVCKPCSDPYYNGHPTGMVFTDEAKAKEYIDHANGPRSEGDTGEYELYLQKGYLE